jgi:hypothetical protein
MNAPDAYTLAQELAARDDRPLAMTLDAASAFQLASLLQLAMRHPSVHDSDSLREVAVRFVAHVREYLADAPAASAVLRMGDDLARDVHKGTKH